MDSGGGIPRTGDFALSVAILRIGDFTLRGLDSAPLGPLPAVFSDGGAGGLSDALGRTEVATAPSLVLAARGIRHLSADSNRKR